MDLCEKPSASSACVASLDVYKTKMLLEKFTFTWIIENFSFCTVKPGDEIISEEFPSGDSRYKWFVQLFPYGQDETDKEYVSCFLHSAAAPKADVYAKYFVSLRDTKNTTIEVINCDVVFHSPEGRGRSRYIKRANLLKSLRGDILKIHVEVTVSTESECSYNELPFVQKDVPQIKLAANIGSLLKDTTYADVIICAEGNELPAHQIILTARSKVFAAMFTHDTLEKETKRIEIPDFDCATIQDMLQFIYGGLLPKFDVAKASNLLQIAEKYELEDLKGICCNYLVSRIDAANVVDFLILADMYNAGNLKEKAVEFISANVKFLDFELYRFRLSHSGNLLVDIMKKLADA